MYNGLSDDADILRDMTHADRLRRLPVAVLGAALLAAPALAGLAPLVPAVSAPNSSVIDGGVDLPFNPLLASVSCPVERGPVKEGSDADRNRVSSTVATTSVASFRTRAKPSYYPRNNRVTATEFHIWQTTAYLTQYKQESDGDIHLVIKDSAGRSMIAELPYASCVPSTSRWRSAIVNARAVFGHTYAVSTSWHYVHRLLDLRGVGFMDTLHGQTGVAPNGAELHPVIYVHFR